MIPCSCLQKSQEKPAKNKENRAVQTSHQDNLRVRERKRISHNKEKLMMMTWNVFHRNNNKMTIMLFGLFLYGE